jgi:SAM-dependent methyltransferase
VKLAGAPPDLDKAALCGEPSYVWREGQQRRLNMILNAFGEKAQGSILENGCGIGMYVEHLLPFAGSLVGLEFDFDRAVETSLRLATQAGSTPVSILCSAGEDLPFPDHYFDAILSHEVLEHVVDDRIAVQEMVRVLKPGGRLAIFVPNRGYPFETHGIYWRGSYHFGNIPLVNWLPRPMRNRLAPHVRVYSPGDLSALFEGQPVSLITRTVIFGAYDNIIARWPKFGKPVRRLLQAMEHTPLKRLGLSLFWVVEKRQG